MAFLSSILKESSRARLLAWDSQFYHLSKPRARTPGVHHHSQMCVCVCVCSVGGRGHGVGGHGHCDGGSAGEGSLWKSEDNLKE